VGFKELNGEGSNAQTINAKDIKVGESVEGYINRFVETSSQKYRDQDGNPIKSISPVFIDEEGNETIVWASGNLKYLKSDLEKKNIPMGVKVRLTSVEPDPKSQFKTYFKFGVNVDDRLENMVQTDDF